MLQPGNRHKRKATWDADKNPEGWWRKFTYEELIARDKTGLDVFWLKDKSLTIWITCRSLTIWRKIL
jgi:type I restriction enzyme M protein